MPELLVFSPRGYCFPWLVEPPDAFFPGKTNKDSNFMPLRGEHFYRASYYYAMVQNKAPDVIHGIVEHKRPALYLDFGLFAHVARALASKNPYKTFKLSPQL